MSKTRGSLNRAGFKLRHKHMRNAVYGLLKSHGPLTAREILDMVRTGSGDRFRHSLEPPALSGLLKRDDRFIVFCKKPIKREGGGSAMTIIWGIQNG